MSHMYHFYDMPFILWCLFAILKLDSLVLINFNYVEKIGNDIRPFVEKKGLK